MQKRRSRLGLIMAQKTSPPVMAASGGNHVNSSLR